MDQKRVVVLGGYGSFGRLVSEAIALQKQAQIVIAGRNQKKGQTFANSVGAQFIECDLEDVNSLRQAIAGAYLVINTAGPFQQVDYTIPKLALEGDCHYIDLGDGRAYVTNIGELDEAARTRNRFVCVGASTSPAITTALVAELQAHFSHIETIKVALSAGNKNEAGVSTVSSILSYAGLPVDVWQNGRWQQMFGWGSGEFVYYPQPVGRRRVQLCNLPDLTLMPPLFEADTVLFKAGLELNLFNYGLVALSWLRRKWPGLSLPMLAPWLISISQLLKPFGSFAGGVAVWVSGDMNSKKIERSSSIIAESNGPQVAVTPTVLLAQKLLTQGPPKSGAFPCIGFLTLTEIENRLNSFGISVVQGPSDK